MRATGLHGQFAFFTPITDAVALATGQAGPQWIVAAEVGVWAHPTYGDVEINAEDIQRMFDNFASGVHPPKPQELPVDFEHLSVKKDRKPGDGIAAGWIQDVELREDGTQLWALVDWTDDAREKIRKKQYKGFSPLFHPNWRAHGKGQVGMTLLGGALTNYQTIPSCVVTCSLDPADVRRLATATDLPYGDRETRVREALTAKFPIQYKAGEPDYTSYVWPRFVFEDRVAFERFGKTWEIAYTFNEDLSVTFDGEPYEVLVTTSPVIAASTIPNEENDMKTFKTKNAKGEDVEIPLDSLGALSLDILAEAVPAVKDLRAKVPTEGTKVVSAVEFDSLTSTVQALSASVETLSADNKRLKDEGAANKAKAIDAEITGLVSSGKMLPADVEFMKSLASTNEELYTARVTALKAAQPVIKLDTVHSVDGRPANGTGPVFEFDSLVTAAKTADPKLSFADAVRKVAAENPALATARNRALSVPIGTGGIPMTSA